MKIIEQIKKDCPLPEYIEKMTGMKWKPIGSWRGLPECPFCSGHNCFRLSPTGSVFCFQCFTYIGNSIQARMLFERITYGEAVDKFKNDLGIKKYDKRDIEWVSMREIACEYSRETLFTSQIKYQLRNEQLTPIEYLTNIRKHSYDAILNFRLGFNDGGLVDHLKKNGYTGQTIKATGLDMLPDNCFLYPFIVNNEIKYFRIKDPNKIKRFQMPLAIRSKDAVWYNQDVLFENQDIFVCEGEDDAISLWDCGVNAVASCGSPTINQINFLKIKELPCVYTAFDGDPAGNRDTDFFIRNYRGNVFQVIIPDGKDIDDLLGEVEDDKKEDLIDELKSTAKPPSAEAQTKIKQENNGYYITGSMGDRRLTNWIISIEAVIIKEEDVRVRKINLKSGDYKTSALMPSNAFSSASYLREFLVSISNKFLYFTGNDHDLSYLIQYLDIVSDPKIVKETDCVGDIAEGFIAENIFISNTGDFRPLTNGFLSLDEKHSIHIIELVRKGSNKSEIPYFPLTEPAGGIDDFKKRVFELLVKNRNLKIALAIGWVKATLWSKMFYQKKRFFPLLVLHGKTQSGKSVLAQWLMSMVGLRDCNPEMLSERGTSEVGLARKFAYYSSLPIFVDDYRNDESGQRFHTFFRGVFDRSSPTKGLKENFGVRRVDIKGCLLLTGEFCPIDPALLSRTVSIEITKQERKDKYFKDIVKIEPHFACIGLNWLRHRNTTFEAFMDNYEGISEILAKNLDDPRQVSVLAVAIAGAMTEPCFEAKDHELIEFAIKLTKIEIEERQAEEILGTIWEAVGVIHTRAELNEQHIYHDEEDETLKINLVGLLSEIKGNQFTRHYKVQTAREVAKILRQEDYFLVKKSIRVNGKVAERWVLNLEKCPENLKNVFGYRKEDAEEL